MTLSISLLNGNYAVVQLKADEPIPEWAISGNLWSLVRTEDELSIVCLESQVPGGVINEGGWQIIKVIGPLDFSLVGILADLTRVLANAGVSIFAISTFNTDYIMVKSNMVGPALQACVSAGYFLVQ